MRRPATELRLLALTPYARTDVMTLLAVPVLDDQQRLAVGGLERRALHFLCHDDHLSG